VREHDPERKRLSDRAFGLLFGGILAALTAVGWLVWHERWIGTGALAAVLLVLGLLAPGLLLPANRAWHRLAGAVGPVTNAVVLGAFFYLVLTPVGALRRAFGADPMHRRPNPPDASYWSPVRRQATRETFEDMF
jgi:hypothetical protein